jgi:DNA-binding LacI/PurR family transcriptional regulator
MGAGQDRLAGYRGALAAADLVADPALVVEGDFSEVSGLQAMRDLLARRPDVDGVFAANDLMAIGALRALRDAGRRVPEEIAVVGFDDSPLSRVTDPPLSTVRQPVEVMGREMAEMLVRLISGTDGADLQQSAVLPTELVVRASS